MGTKAQGDNIQVRQKPRGTKAQGDKTPQGQKPMEDNIQADNIPGGQHPKICVFVLGACVYCIGASRKILGFCPPGILSAWILSSMGFCPCGVLSLWGFVPLGFCLTWILSPWAFVPMGFCPPGFLSSLDFVRLDIVLWVFVQWGFVLIPSSHILKKIHCFFPLIWEVGKMVEIIIL